MEGKGWQACEEKEEKELVKKKPAAKKETAAKVDKKPSGAGLGPDTLIAAVQQGICGLQGICGFNNTWLSSHELAENQQLTIVMLSLLPWPISQTMTNVVFSLCAF